METAALPVPANVFPAVLLAASPVLSGSPTMSLTVSLATVSFTTARHATALLTVCAVLRDFTPVEAAVSPASQCSLGAATVTPVLSAPLALWAIT